MNKNEFFNALNIFQIILWGYSTLQLALIVVLGLLPQPPSGTDDPIGGLVAYSPMFLLLVIIIIRHKHFSWNIWRVILTVYSVLFSFLLTALIVLSSVYKPTYSGTSETTHSGFSLGLLFLIPIFVLFVVLGKEILNKKT